MFELYNKQVYDYSLLTQRIRSFSWAVVTQIKSRINMATIQKWEIGRAECCWAEKVHFQILLTTTCCALFCLFENDDANGARTRYQWYRYMSLQLRNRII